MPEYKKRWPKYHYYYEWMRERVAAACGALPAPVLDKLLAQARWGACFLQAYLASLTVCHLQWWGGRLLAQELSVST